MTTINYDRDNYRLEINGHAGSAPPGEDLVCSAVTSLAVALTARCEDVPQYEPAIYTNQPNGIVIVACNPERRFKTRCREMMDTVFAGYEQLANFYPEFIRIGGNYGDT